MMVLDTNVVSEMMKDTPETAVVAWLRQQPKASIWITSVTVFEVQYGLGLMAAGAKQKLLVAAFDELLATDLKGHILPFDTAAAGKAATLMANRRKAGKPLGAPADGLIGGIVLARKAMLATRNVRHFRGTGVKLIDPWTS